MLGVEIRFIADGREVSPDSLTQGIATKLRHAFREELNRLPRQDTSANVELPPVGAPTERPPLAVSKREAARLLGISVRTLDNYVALKVI